MTTLIITISNLEPTAMSSNNLFLIDSVGQLELKEEGLPSKFDKINPFEQRVILKKTSRIKNTKSYCIIIITKQMREFTLVDTISSVDNTKPPRLLLSHATKEIYKDDP
jgi:nucleoside-triphosphatase THEP1